MTSTIKQEFQSEIEVKNIAGHDVINIYNESARLLIKEERKLLNDKVRELEKYGKEGWRTWKFLHATIGVNNIEEMNLEHRDAAHAILDSLIEYAQLEKSSKIVETIPIVETTSVKSPPPVQRRKDYSAIYFFVIVLANVAFIMYQGKVLTQLTPLVKNQHTCEYNNQTYSIGSVINMQKDYMRCTVLENQNYPIWENVKRNKNGKK